VREAAWPARRWLHAAYYAERDFKKAHGRWAETLVDLGVPPPGSELADPTIETTTDLFEVSVTLTRTGAASERWHIREDGRIWK
jgi:hypothetical protein